MGRPLNKKYFGNRNVGTASTTDNGLGGNQIDSVTLNASYLGNYTTRPTITFPDPDYVLLGATTATAVIVSEANTATVTTSGSGYVAGDLITLVAADGGTGIAYVATTSSGAIASVNFTGTGADRGTFNALPGAKFAVGGTAPKAVTLTGGGSGGEITVYFRAKSVTMTNKGSGYTTAIITSGTTVTGVSAGMTQATSGTVVFGSSTTVGNNENAIICYAYLPTSAATGLISGAGGSSTVLGDIVKQRGRITYTVETAQGLGKVKLVNTSTLVAGQMYIQATDSVGGTYYVSKLFSRTAVVYPGTGTQFSTGTRVLWTFGTPVVNKSIKIANG
jgi:hypothetical protein